MITNNNRLIESEQTVLGTLILGDHNGNLLTNLNLELFSDYRSKQIFHLLNEMKNDGEEISKETLKNNFFLKHKKDSLTLSELENYLNASFVKANNCQDIDLEIEILKKRALTDKIKNDLDRARQIIDMNPDQAIEILENSLKSTNVNARDDILPLSKIDVSNIKVERFHFLLINSVNILEGEGGLGKSTLIAYICERFLEKYSNKKILYVYGEGRFSDHVCRFTNKSDRIYLTRGTNFKKINQLFDFIKRNSINLLVLDPVIAISNRWGFDLKNDIDSRNLTGIFEEYQENNELTVCLIRHLTKLGSGRGNIELREASRACYRLVNRNELILDKANSDILPTEIKINFTNKKIINLEENFETIENLETCDLEGIELAKRMIRILFKNRQILPSKVVIQNGEELGLNKNTIRRAWQSEGYKSYKKAHVKYAWFLCRHPECVKQIEYQSIFK